MAKFASTSMARKLSEPMPATFIAFSMEECVCVEQYAIEAPIAALAVAGKTFVIRSRADNSAQSEELDAVS